MNYYYDPFTIQTYDRGVEPDFCRVDGCNEPAIGIIIPNDPGCAPLFGKPLCLDHGERVSIAIEILYG